MKNIKDIEKYIKTIETLADQTAVHRKKFEFVMSQLRKFNLILIKSDFSLISNELSDNIYLLLQDIFQLLNQNILQTWAQPTIENNPNYVLDQIKTIFLKIHQLLISNNIIELSNLFNPDSSEWLQYNLLDLKAILASFTNYLKSSDIPEFIKPKIQHRIESINEILKNYSTENFAIRTFSPIPLNYHSWLVKYSDFEELNEVGRGVSAIVYQGIHKNTTKLVAIKKFRFNKLNGSRFQSYQREVAVLATDQHPNLLKLIGATEESPFCIITEWMNGGTLYKAIHQSNFLSPTERTIAAFDIVRGMQFLHSRNIVHRDLKTLNVLLDDNKKIKICDFGFSRFASENTLMTSNIGTPHWMAPELLMKGTRYSSKIDIYAFGIVLWELATSETPYSGYEASQIVQQVIHNDLRPLLPSSLNPELRNIITQCWDRNPDVRPTFDEIFKQFKYLNLIFDFSNLE